MRPPRDISGRDLARGLRRYGDEVTREAGSHMRLTTQRGGEHHVTIPDHPNLRVGTLAAVLAEVGRHFGVERDIIASEIFGR